MNCQTFRDLWHDRADGEISAADTAALDAHAASCEACRQYDAQMRAVFAGLDRLRDQPVAVKMAPHHVGSRRFAPLRIAAAVALFVGASWLMSSAVRDQVPPHPRDALVDAGPTRAADSKTTLSLSGESATMYLALAKPSRDPNVKLYWLYRVPKEETQ